MAIVVILTLLSIAQAVLGRPIYADAFYNLGGGISSIVVSRFPANAPY